jgi:hypothetical protein
MFDFFDNISEGTGDFFLEGDSRMLESEFGFLGSFFYWVKMLAAVIIFLFGIGLFYNIRLLLRLKQKQLSEMAKLAFLDLPDENRFTKWEEIKRRLDSDNVSDWKMSILEADSLMDEILARVGYKGKNLGERLLKILPEKFASIKEVSEAHLVCERIVREGASFSVAREEAERVIGLYEKGLKELQFIS